MQWNINEEEGEETAKGKKNNAEWKEWVGIHVFVYK